MKTLILTMTAAMMALTLTAPVRAASTSDFGITTDAAQTQIDKRRKPRVPGGSGCDSPHDLIEHPECN